jgi:choline monooxygenase
MTFPLHIDPDITRARTLPAHVYRSTEVYDLAVADMFPHTWQLVSASHAVLDAGQMAPWRFMEGSVNEPLLAVRDETGSPRIMSNVCTHRGALLVDAPGSARTLRCRYHGRQFGLDGRCQFMPEFQDVVDFPADEDHLSTVAYAQWGPFLFASLDPLISFEQWLGPIRSRVDWMPLAEFKRDPDTCRTYHVDANWALYGDNYLEGFHIPYIHPGLVSALDHKAYRTELFDQGSVQIGVASPGEDAFTLPDDHPDAGLAIAGYYFFLFPNTLLNFYPWGLSVNLLLPQSAERTRIDYLSYVWDASRRSQGAGSDLHKVEMEDEAVVASVQQGIQSRLYTRGRYSPSCETGVHQFHHLLAGHLNAAWERRRSR